MIGIASSSRSQPKLNFWNKKGKLKLTEKNPSEKGLTMGVSALRPDPAIPGV